MEVSICHTGDLHFSPENLVESETCFDQIFHDQSANPPTVFLINGDSTDHRLDVHSKAFLSLAKRIKHLSDLAPVILLQGTYSHEPVGTIEILSLVSGRYPIAVANRICQIALADKSWIYSERSVFAENELDLSKVTCVFTCVPTTNKATTAAMLNTTEYVAQEMGAQIQTYLKGTSVINQFFSYNGIPTIGISHGTVHGCLTEHGVPMVGFDHEFTSEALFDAQCSAFMLNHIHKHQLWTKGDRQIAYSGSIGRFHYGETDDKGYLLWRVGPTSATFEFKKTPACDMKMFDFDTVPEIEVLKQLAVDCYGSYVRVRWQVDQEHAQVLQRFQVEEIFSNAKEVQVDIQILKIQRARAEGINQANTLFEKLAMWGSNTSINTEPLSDRLSLLMTDTPTNIGESIVTDLNKFELSDDVVG